PGWRAAVLTSEQRRLSSAREGGRQRLTSASLSERSEQYARRERMRSFLCEEPRGRRIQSARREQLWLVAASAAYSFFCAEVAAETCLPWVWMLLVALLPKG